MNPAYSSSPPLGVYIHFPYCAQRCPYCDFTLTTRRFSHERYADAVLAELKAREPDLTQAPPLTSVYFGGGTPGLWSPRQLQRVIEALSQRFGLSADVEVTIEANPAELTLELAEAWRGAGVNRLSLGTQSFQAERLSWLGRSHSPEQAKQAVSWARQAGFENLNLDLMHGFKGQRVEDAVHDLEETLSLTPEHVSLYQLTVEEQTSFGARARRGERLLEPEGRLVELYEALSEALSDAGSPLYEVSNAARPGYESKHNTLYWTLGQYLALGAGAHGLLLSSRGEDQVGLRWCNVKRPERYMEVALAGQLEALEEERSELDQEALLEEQVLVGFRLYEGFVVSEALRRHVGERARAQVEAGLMEDDGVRWRATDQGRLLLNRLIMNLLT